jgi:3'-phosphoadenosine 5'-phosphosulfate sulfotransferase (PAPS reductase)/FAD synthetase
MRTALQFSGGKDSLACLYLYKKHWNDIYVCWLNSGAAYPEVIEHMEGWKARLPNFIEIRANQPENIEKNGYPSDVVPLRYTAIGNHGVRDVPGLRIQSYLQCCHDNLWMPMREKMIELGVERIIRGQRNSESYKGPIRHGQVVDGIEYVLPLQDWSESDVFAYLKKVGAEIPAYYATETTSRDCWNCTAYRDTYAVRTANLKGEMRTEVDRRLKLIGDAIRAESRGYLEI